MSVLSRGRSGAVELDAVRAALAAVEDPELHQPLGTLGMLGEVELGHGGRVIAHVRLTTASCPLKDTVASRVQRAAAGVNGVDRVEVRFESMSEQERMRLAQQLRGGRAEGSHPFGSGCRTRIYAVASGKGGVGKSSVAANVAAALAARGERVGLLDADVWGWSVPQLFGVRRAPVALKGLMLPVERHGVALMSVGFLTSGDEPVVWRGPMLHKAIQQFLGDVHWGDLDTLVIDLPPGTGDVTLSLLELVPDAALLAVTTPQPVARGVATRIGRMARDLSMPVAGVVENMSALRCAQCGASSALFGEGGGQVLADAIEAPLLGSVPLDLELRESGDAGVPVVLSAPGSHSARVLDSIAGRLPVVRRSLVGRMIPLSVV